MDTLPHAYPFRLVEPREGDVEHGIPAVAPSLGGALPRQVHRGAVPGYPLTLAVEAMAQSVLAAPPRELHEGDVASGRAHLAGIEEARLLAPIAPGDRLEARSEVAGRFGPAVKVRCRLERDGEAVAEATLLVTLGA